MQTLISLCILTVLILVLVAVLTWASHRSQERARRKEQQARECRIRDLEDERHHQRQVLHLSAMAQVEILQRAINRLHEGASTSTTALLGDALAQQVDILQYAGSSMSGEILEVVPTPLLPLLRRLKLAGEGNVHVDCVGAETWARIATVAPRGKLAQALGHLLRQLMCPHGTVEIRASIEGEQAVLTMQSSMLRPNLYATFSTAMARNWIVAARGEVVQVGCAYRISLPFERDDEADEGGNQAVILPARKVAN